MTFVYEGHPSADQMVTAFLQSAFVSTGAKTYVIVPHKAQIMEVGYVPITDSCTSATTLAVLLGSNANSVASGFVVGSTNVCTSTIGSFSAVANVVGGCCSVSITGSVVANRGDALQFTMSGGDAGTKNALVYAIFRRSDPQGTQEQTMTEQELANVKAAFECLIMVPELTEKKLKEKLEDRISEIQEVTGLDEMQIREILWML